MATTASHIVVIPNGVDLSRFDGAAIRAAVAAVARRVPMTRGWLPWSRGCTA